MLLPAKPFEPLRRRDVAGGREAMTRAQAMKSRLLALCQRVLVETFAQASDYPVQSCEEITGAAETQTRLIVDVAVKILPRLAR